MLRYSHLIWNKHFLCTAADFIFCYSLSFSFAIILVTFALSCFTLQWPRIFVMCMVIGILFDFCFMSSHPVHFPHSPFFCAASDALVPKYLSQFSWFGFFVMLIFLVQHICTLPVFWCKFLFVAQLLLLLFCLQRHTLSANQTLIHHSIAVIL